MSDVIAVASPLLRPWHFTALELVFVGCAVLTFLHARRDRYALVQWLASVAYGVGMELIAFNFLHNYVHSQFTVELYHHLLPLYVVAVYPVFFYTGLKLVEAWRLPLVTEALLAGLAMLLLDMPFDLVGVDAGWWHWLSSDPMLSVRWFGVPVTSFYWYLAFGAAFALLSRILRAPLGRRAAWVGYLCAPFLGLGIIVVGTLLFLPFHGLHALGVGESSIVLLHLLLCVALFGWSLRAGGQLQRHALAPVPLAIGGLCLVVEAGLHQASVGKAATLLIAWLGSLLFALLTGAKRKSS